MAGRVCMCGEIHPHTVAVRKLIDGRTIRRWSNGGLTMAFGTPLPGCDHATEPWTEDADARAGEVLFMWADILSLEETIIAWRWLRAHFRAITLSKSMTYYGPPSPELARRLIFDAIDGKRTALGSLRSGEA